MWSFADQFRWFHLGPGHRRRLPISKPLLHIGGKRPIPNVTVAGGSILVGLVMAINQAIPQPLARALWKRGPDQGDRDGFLGRPKWPLLRYC